mgnify:CR=1 FL=1|tara:strand:+ start:359 stop:952 length:594 start_codon:yes stop_codon:yes gene_type:complete
MEKLNKHSLLSLVDKKLTEIYNKEKRTINYRFGRAVNGWVSDLEYDQSQDVDLVKIYTTLNENGTCGLRQLGRLRFGYNGLGFRITPSKVGLQSKASLFVKSSDCTSDHVLGVTPVGWKIHEVILRLLGQGFSKESVVKYMIENWLSFHLHYWVEAKITKLEHKEDNLARDKHSLEDKLNLVHYDEGNIQLLNNQYR